MGIIFFPWSQVQTKSEVVDLQQGNSSLILSDRTVETKEEDIQSFTNKLEPVTEGNLEILDWCGDNLTKFQQTVVKEFGRHLACYCYCILVPRQFWNMRSCE